MSGNYRERYRRLKTRSPRDWWTATFGDPVSWIVLAFIGDWKSITPNRLTVLTFITKVLASAMIAFGDRSLAIAGAIVLQAGVLFDHMDGNLARYRNASTLKGGFMDRILDGLSVLILFSALSWHVYTNGAPAIYLLLGPLAAGFYLTICYIYWTYAFMEYRELGDSQKTHPGAKNISTSDISTLTYILKGQKKFFNFNHIDYYFWVSLSIILGLPEAVLWLLVTVVGYKVIDRFRMRIKNLKELDEGIRG